MHTALFLAYYYLPANDVATIRSGELVRKLVQRNWRVVIITGTDPNRYPKGKREDESAVRVVYVREFPLPPQSFSIGDRTTPVLLGDRTLGWIPFAVREAERVLREEKISCIFAAYPPASSFLTGLHLSKKHKIPLILEYRDPWLSENPFGVVSTPHRLLLRFLERIILGHSDLVMAVSESYGASVHRVDGRTKVHIVPDGYSASQFERVSPEPIGKRVYLHIGTLYGLRAREVGPFLRALKQTMDRGIVDSSSMRVVLVGGVSRNCARLIHSLGLRELVELRPAVEHDRAIGLIKGAHCLLLFPGHPSATPAKLFEYIAARRPILNMGSEHGFAAKMIRTTNSGITCGTDTARIREAIISSLGWKDDPIDSSAVGLDFDSQMASFVDLLESVVH